MARFPERLDPMVDAQVETPRDVLLARIPVYDQIGYAVFDEPFDLPIDNLRAAFVVPAEKRLALRREITDAVPRMLPPAGK